MDGKQPKPEQDEPFSFLNSVIVVGGWEENPPTLYRYTLQTFTLSRSSLAQFGRAEHNHRRRRQSNWTRSWADLIFNFLVHLIPNHRIPWGRPVKAPTRKLTSYYTKYFFMTQPLRWRCYSPVDQRESLVQLALKNKATTFFFPHCGFTIITVVVLSFISFYLIAYRFFAAGISVLDCICPVDLKSLAMQIS